MTGNKFGDEGAKAMSEILKVNTTLTVLSLDGEEKEIRERERKEIKKNGRQKIRLEMKEQWQ